MVELFLVCFFLSGYAFGAFCMWFLSRAMNAVDEHYYKDDGWDS